MSEQASQQSAQQSIVSTSVAHISGAAERYARALFELGRDEKALDTIEAELNDFAVLLDDNKDLQRLVVSPVFSADDQLAALSKIFDKAKFNGIAANMIKTATSNRRLFAVRDIITSFKQQLADHQGKVSADIVSAEKLSAAQVKDLQGTLKKKLGKDISLNLRVDPMIMGGLIIKVGSKMIDTSLRTKLNSLKIALKEVH